MGIDWEELLGADGEDLDRAYNDAIPDWGYGPYGEPFEPPYEESDDDDGEGGEG